MVCIPVAHICRSPLISFFS
jgi:import inner membrane translocase subunit TIM16